MRLVTNDQRSAEWRAARIGCITGSNAWRAISGPKTQQTYTHQLIAETLTGMVPDFDNTAMKWGRDHEHEMLDLYADTLTPASYIERIGFVLHDNWDKVGCSVDAISDDRIVEGKCPFNSANHLSHLLGEIKREHVIQCKFNCWVCGKEIADFISFDPRFPPSQQLYVKEIELDDKTVTKFEEEIPKVLEQMDNILYNLMEAI